MERCPFKITCYTKKAICNNTSYFIAKTLKKEVCGINLAKIETFTILAMLYLGYQQAKNLRVCSITLI